MIVTAIYQRINLFNRTLLLMLLGILLAMGAIIWGFSQMDKDLMNSVSTTAANIMLMTIIVGFIAAGVKKRSTSMRHS